MRDSTKLLIKKYALMKLKYDFMGYPFTNKTELSFHHLIVPKRLCADYGLGRGYADWNGAILKQSTAHDYLHIIENNDPEKFYDISSEIIDEKLKGYLDPQNLKMIDDILNCFEKEFCGATFGSGNKPLIKDAFTKRVVKENKLILKMK